LYYRSIILKVLGSYEFCFNLQPPFGLRNCAKRTVQQVSKKAEANNRFATYNQKLRITVGIVIIRSPQLYFMDCKFSQVISIYSDAHFAGIRTTT